MQPEGCISMSMAPQPHSQLDVWQYYGPAQQPLLWRHQRAAVTCTLHHARSWHLHVHMLRQCVPLLRAAL